MSSWLVESYWPPAAGSPDLAAERLRTLVGTDGSRAARLVGGVHLPGDEIMLWRFEADEPDTIRQQMDAAGITYERIVEAVETS